ncbi:uncharacterized protein H6S33_002402 [Morchella sextelata]|uniref:uncharacterized protein n=1 Tax=Morchella sextelata TaxID=1174677 RepID=UPI001D055E17|nr:uncharacterized protein H6S33_002402 [Morchella sextelata]KAH0607368.1 hypothetical protein H6S33_002402 [Morchella sextelata]
MRSSPVLLLLALALPALTSPIPQEGNEQIDRFNVSPTPTLDAVPSATATPSAAGAPEPVDPAMQALAKPPQIDADDGMKSGMGAAMAGLGSATSALSALPVVGGLGGSLGGRDVAVKKRWALLEGLPVVGPLLGSGLAGRVKRTLFPTLASMPDMGSSGVVNVGHKAKREANLLSSLPLLGSLTGGKVKRQLDGLTGVLGILGNLGGGLGGSKAKRDPAFEALGEVPGVATTLLKAFGKQNRRRQLDGIPVLGPLLGGGLGNISPRGEDPLAQIKKMAAVVADIRGVTSKREAEAEAEATPEQGDFRQGLRKAADAKIEGELNKVEDKSERKIKIKNTKFPGGKVKSPKEALDKREAEALGLDALPVKDAVEGATGLKSTMDLVKNLSSQVENRNGK